MINPKDGSQVDFSVIKKKDLPETFENFRSIDDKAILYLKLWNSLGTIFIFFISKGSALFDLLESFLTTKSPEGLRASQLACRVVLFFQNSSGCLGKQPLHHPRI